MELVDLNEFTIETGCVSKLPRQKMVNVTSLDESSVSILLPINASGAELFVAAITRLKILESDYFDLDYVEEIGRVRVGSKSTK